MKFNHFNFNVLDLEKSLAFYDKALGLHPLSEKTAADGSFKLVFLGDGQSDFRLELTWLKDRTKPYDLGEGEYHLAMSVPDHAGGPPAARADGGHLLRKRGHGHLFHQRPRRLLD